MENFLIAGFATTLLASLLIGYRKSKASSSSLTKYYLGDRKLSNHDLGHLLGATSMSLNGIFYHGWLGYKVGIYSVVIQMFWAASFLLFIFAVRNFVILAKKDSLFGNLERYFGRSSAVISAIAVSFTMIALIGWEFSIAGTLAKEIFNLDATQGVLVVVSVVLISAIYTIRGGMFANKSANIVQNYMKIVAFLAIIALSLVLMTDPSRYLNGFGYNAGVEVNVLKWSPIDAAIGVGGLAALLCNLLFSFFWQPADATAWQNFSAGAENGTSTTRKARQSNLYAMARILVFPGIAGTFMGMSMAYVPNLTDANIMATMIQVYSQLPYGGILTFAIAVLLTAAMLSTIDGLLLGLSYTANRDVLHGKQFDQLMSRPESEGRPSDTERSMLSIGKLIIMIGAAASIGLYLLIDNGYLGLFQTVYLAVIGQMAVVPLVLGLLWKKDLSSANEMARRYGFAPVLLGLIAGSTCFVLFVSGVPMAFVSENPVIGGVPFIILGAPAAFLATTIGMLVLSRASRNSNSVSVER